MKKSSEEKKTVAKSVVVKAKNPSEKKVTGSAKKPAVKLVSADETVVKKTVDKIIAEARKSVAKVEKKAVDPVKKKAVAKVEKKVVVPVKKSTVAKVEKTDDDDTAKKRSRKPKIDRKLKMTKAQQKHYRDLLLKLRKEYSDQISFHQNEALIMRKDANGERAGSATHMADLGSDTSRRDMELSLLNDESDIIQMIDVALKKLEASEYGICLECGCAIPPARLEAKPYARYCTACKAKMEESEDPQRRHR